MKKNILVDMSCTLIHHGHIRILKKASKFGNVIIALTSDQQIKKYKNIKSELNFKQRKEILLSIKFVKKVIKSNFFIDKNFLIRNKIDILVHGSDNKNDPLIKNIKIFDRTPGISSTVLRKRAKMNFR